VSWPALATAFGLLFAAELLLPGPAAQTPHESLVIPPTAPDETANANISQWGNTALARPLFNADRRPVSTANTDADGALPRLSAIIVTGRTSSAIFSASGQKPQVVREGDEIDGYRIEAIAPDGVKLTGPDGLVTLHPQFETDGPPPLPSPQTN
jgi:hypothetical protein